MSQTLDILALAVCFFGLAAWLNLFKFASKRWRFEFFTIDFTVGALLVSALAAVSLGNLDAELGLSDRLLVSSRTAQALVFLSGVLLGLGLCALFAAARLTGISASATITFSLAALISSSVTLTSNNILLSAVSLALLFAAILLAAKATRGQDAPFPAVKNARQPAPARLRQSSKGILLALAAGLLLGGALPIGFSGIGGGFGLGPYAGMLVGTGAALIAAGLFSLLLLHIKIDLPPSTLRAYWSRSGTSKGQHRYGFLSGILGAAGALGFLIVRMRNSTDAGLADPSLLVPKLVAASALVVAAFSGILFWKERTLTKSQLAAAVALLLFAGGVVCGAFAGEF